ncbi:hypothetical protein K2173_013465 [Erythroxylum novogranatense]|uniref:NAD-dependent epimerase/dehydratase domain-containing protein n=1 Tax=Erythroxylum novogranatense TaxID=1862640 RepID=A0AAV8SA00_9ROSI|nr:hypothetical protein K2173_013465 [Erythroxylum novogranatense]
MEGEKGEVCITGGTGFVASWLIMRLLEHGYSVNTIIRPDPDHKRDVSFLTSLPGASEKLRIFEADLSDPESFGEAVKGCIGVFHVATPVDFENREPVELHACLKSKTVKRVVYTSSASAVAFNDKDVDVMDETYWTDVEYVRAKMTFGASYFISKTMTEKKALEFAEEHKLDLVTLIPTFVIGPFICPKLPGSVHTSLAMLFGEKEQYGSLLSMSMVHVDDVARAHIFLFELPEARGRYNCSSHTVTIQELAKFLSAKYPEFPMPTIESLKDIKGFKAAELSSEKLLKSGFSYKYRLHEMVDEAIQCCKENGYLFLFFLLQRKDNKKITNDGGTQPRLNLGKAAPGRLPEAREE